MPHKIMPDIINNIIQNKTITTYPKKSLLMGIVSASIIYPIL